MPTPSANEIVAFWRAAGPAKWFAKDAALDAEIIRRFEAAHHAAARGEMAGWGDTADGALALLILLDQFPRNIWRGSAHAFATDPLARSLALAAIAAGHDLACDAAMRVFFYLPLEHSEALADQDLCLAKCADLDAASGSEWSKWAALHRDIIVRFGRFPHRNACLGRASTAEELAFLEQGGFAG
ncbi:MAG: DUF924 domain-containing protein [Sphingomonadales bacterium]|nr:DUF924 domain-containing protein [Sphingomonadales bacterium]